MWLRKDLFILILPANKIPSRKKSFRDWLTPVECLCECVCVLLVFMRRTKMETDAVEAFRGLMFRYRAIGSVSHAISVWMCARVYKMHFRTHPTHTDLTAAHLSVSVHRTHSLFSREMNLYGFSAVDVDGRKSKCACVLSLFLLFWNENDGIFLFHVTAKCLHNCACTPDLQCCNFWAFCFQYLKGIVNLKWKILSFSHPRAVTNMYDFRLSVEHKSLVGCSFFSLPYNIS